MDPRIIEPYHELVLMPEPTHGIVIVIGPVPEPEPEQKPLQDSKHVTTLKVKLPIKLV